MQSNNPKTIAGKIYPEFALSLVISPKITQQDSFSSASVVLKLSPLRRDNGKVEILQEQEHQYTLISSDIFVENDPVLMQAVGTIQYAIQQFIDAKNL